MAIQAVCIARPQGRVAGSIWVIDNHEYLFVECNRSPQAWDTMRVQHSYVTLYKCNDEGIVLPKTAVDVPTSSHSAAVLAYIANTMRQQGEIHYHV